MSTRRDHENLTRFSITPSKAFGVSMANLQKLAKSLGRDHELAAALWDTGWYEARMLASLVDEPARVIAEAIPQQGGSSGESPYGKDRAGVVPPGAREILFALRHKPPREAALV